MALFEIEALDPVPSAAARQFHAHYLPLIQADLLAQPELLVILFPPADHTHIAWRLAAIQALARESVPARVNAIAGGGGQAQLAAVRYLEAAAGVTGQYLPLDAAGAAVVVSASK